VEGRSGGNETFDGRRERLETKRRSADRGFDQKLRKKTRRRGGSVGQSPRFKKPKERETKLARSRDAKGGFHLERRSSPASEPKGKNGTFPRNERGAENQLFQKTKLTGKSLFEPSGCARIGRGKEKGGGAGVTNAERDSDSLAPQRHDTPTRGLWGGGKGKRRPS